MAVTAGWLTIRTAEWSGGSGSSGGFGGGDLGVAGCKLRAIGRPAALHEPPRGGALALQLLLAGGECPRPCGSGVETALEGHGQAATSAHVGKNVKSVTPWRRCGRWE